MNIDQEENMSQVDDDAMGDLAHDLAKDEVDRRGLKILNCPFCGMHKGGLLVKEDVIGTNRFFVFCMFCLSQGPVRKSKKDAFFMWNNRKNSNNDRMLLREIGRLGSLLLENGINPTGFKDNG